MKLPQIAALATAILVATGSAALARDPIPASGDHFTVFNEVEGWTVYTDTDQGVCLAERKDELGNVFQMGLTKNHKHGYIGVFTLADIDAKNLGRVDIAVDDYLFSGRIHTLKSKKLEGDYSGEYIVVKDENMVTAIEQGHVLVAFAVRPELLQSTWLAP